MAESKSKLEEQDIPKILAAIQTAVESRKAWALMVKGASNGGIIDIRLTLEVNYK